MLVMAKKNTSGVALVAGGSGIVGHAVAKELKRQGWTVRTLVFDKPNRAASLTEEDLVQLGMCRRLS
jgi:nucleoside-diphosphate-sugar epimerase